MERGHLLSELAAAVGGSLTLAGTDERILHLVIDSRKPIPADGALFIALRGPHHDGHAYIAELRERGVRNMLINADHTGDVSALNVIRVSDTLAAMQQLCAWHRSQFHYPVIGITGSNGKTVVKEWLYQLLREEEHIVRSPGSWNSQVGVPLSVWEMGPEHSLGLFEAGIGQPGEMERIAPIIAPTIGVFTNLGPAHGEHFTSDRQKADEKLKLFAAMGSEAALIYCRDHAVVHEAVSAAGFAKRVHMRDWSRKEKAFMHVVSEKVRDARTEVVIESGGKTEPFIVPFTDAASIENAIHCIAVLKHLGRSADQIAARLLHLAPVAMRMRMLAGVRGSRLIDDSYSNDLGSLSIALDHLVRMGGERQRVVVTSDILESSEAPERLYPRMAALLQRAEVDQVYAVGASIAAQRKAFGTNAQFFNTVDELLAGVKHDALDGAAILVKGARALGLERVVDNWQERTHGTELRIDLDAVRHNLNHYRRTLGKGTRVMAMVKAFGYGGGAVELAQLFEHEGVHYLGVAYADEGIELRQHGIRIPILVMNPEPVAPDVLHRFQLEAEVYDLRSLEEAIRFAKHVPNASPVHIKLDTGMHRLGFTEDQLPALLEALANAGSLRVASTLSHLAASEDQQHDDFTRSQIAHFNAMADRITELLGYSPLRHIANSAGSTRFAEARMDMVRLGIGLHGIGADASETAQLQPVATLHTVIAQVKHIPKGDSVSYGRRFIAPKDMRIAILPIGYADGLARRVGNGVGKVWIGGKAAAFVGTICMDMCMVDVTDLSCQEGDEAIVFGHEHPVQEYAQDLGTIPYEALTSISQRVRRVYTHS